MRTLYACLIVSLMASAASADTLPAAKTREVVHGVRSCLAAVNSQKVDVEKLRQDGWVAMSASEAGKPVASHIPLFSKGNLLLILQSDTLTPICAIMAKVPNVPAVGDIANAMDRALNSGRKVKDGKAIPAYWLPIGHIVELATTGSVDAPGVRIVVGYRK